MQIKVIEVPDTTTNYVRPSFTSQWHIAVGRGRKPSGKTICGIKRIAQHEGDLPMWADTSVSPRSDLCTECAGQ